MIQSGNSLHPESFGLLVLKRKENVNDTVRIVQVVHVDCMFSHQKHDYCLQLTAILRRVKFGYRYDVSQQGYYLSGHLLIGES